MKDKIFALSVITLLSLMVIVNGMGGSAIQNTAQAAGNNEVGPAGNFNSAFSKQNLPGQASRIAPVIGFVKINDAPGESTDPNHIGEIEILSFQQGITNTPPEAGGGSTGKAVLDEATFEHELDSSSPKLMTLTANGKHLPTATFTIRRDNLEIYTVILTDVTVTHVKQKLAGNSIENAQTGLREEVGLKFAKIEWKYFPVNATGTPGTPVTGTFNLLTNSTSAN